MEQISQDWFLIPYMINLVLFAYIRHNERDSNRPEDYYIENRCIARITATL